MTTIPRAPVRVGKPAVAALGLLAAATGTLESVVTPTLPLLQRELSMTPAQGALLGITMLVTGALVTPIAGNLGDRHGGRRVMLRLMAVVVAGGLVSAAAPNLPVLLIGQILQGAMVGAMPLSFILVRTYLPAGESQVAIGVVSGLFVGGGMLGTLIAGPLAEQLSRHWMFAVPTIAIAVATLLVRLLLPDDPPARSDGAGIDWPGLVLLSGVLLTFMAGLAIAPEAAALPLPLVAVVLLLVVLVAAWIRVERRSPAPMVDLALLAKPAIRSAYAITFAVCAGTAVATHLVPQLLAASAEGPGFGADSTDIGRYLLPGAVAAAVSGPLGGAAARRFGGTAVVAAGVAVMTAALTALALFHSEIWHLVVAKTLIALASGVCVTAMVVRTATAVDRDATGTATGLVLVTRVIGFAAGVQLSGALLTAGTPAGTDDAAGSAYVTGFLVAGAVTALSLFALRKTTEGAGK